MKIQEAYLKAIEYPIKDLPHLIIKRPGGADGFFLVERGEMVIITKDPSDEMDSFVMTIEDLFSDSWEIEVNK